MSAVPKRVARVVDERDGQACVACGADLRVVSGSRHHRRRRAIGGHTIPNLILLCGSGTTGCHGHMHSNVVEARNAGYIIPANGFTDVEPFQVPIHTWANGWVYLRDDGGIIPISRALAAKAMADLYGGDW